MTAAPQLCRVTDRTRVRLHSLSMRANGTEWVVGRVETSDFIAIPSEGQRVIELLGAGLSVGEVSACLQAVSEQDLDIVEFVESLLDLGFVAELDERPVEQRCTPPATFGWLHQRYVNWTLHPLTALAVGAIVLVGIAMLIRRPALFPSYQDLTWDNRGSLAILGNATLGWTIVLLHELGHLCTARAAGVPGRITLGTRLQFLVAQTDVTGIWTAPRRTRFTVYLSGIAVNLMIATTTVLVRTFSEPQGTVDQVAAAACAISLLSILTQFLVFMRTDLYFVLQDFAGARNLYADSTCYLRDLALRLRPRATPLERPDSTDALSPRERRVVVVYAPVLLFGTAACLAAAVTITIPATITILGHAIHTILTARFRPPDTVQLCDAITTLLLAGGMFLLWIRTWWHGHAHQARAAAHALHRLSKEVMPLSLG